MTGDHEQHRAFEDLAVRHVMGVLEQGEASTFRSHLLDCADCRARVGELRAIASDLASVERDERRQRVARQVETKERETTESDGEDRPSGPRTPPGGRALVIVGVMLIILLSVWNFVLRGQNDGLSAALDAEQSAAEVINFGQPWVTLAGAAGVEGIARVERGSLAVMVRGTDDRAPYRITLSDAQGVVLDSLPIRSVNQQVRYFQGPKPAGVVQVDVTLNRTSGDTVVYRATDPSAIDGG